LPESAIATKAPVVPMDRWQDLAHQYGLATLPDSWREASESLRHQRNIDYLETFNDREEIYYTLIGNEFLQDIVCYHPEQVHTYWLKDLAQYVFIIE